MQKENYEIWLEGTQSVNYSRTVLPYETEILIVGGGITGVTSLYLLAKAGKKPILLEKRKLGESVTDCTTGFLSQLVDTRPSRLIKLFGLEDGRLVLESHKNAIDNIEKIIITEKIDCDFKRCSSYIYANNKKEEKDLIKMAAEYNKLGVSVEYKKDNKLKFNTFGYIEIPNLAKFNAIKYITSLAEIAVKNGAIIAEGTRVLNLIDGNKFVNVEVENVGSIKAKKVLAATYIPFKNDYLKHKYSMYRSYVIEYKIPKNVLIEGTYQDSLKPYHYFRVDKSNDFDRLIIGGNDNLEIIRIDHETGARIIRNYTKELFRNDIFIEVRHWSGLISEPADELAYIGESKNGNIFYAFGFSGNGLTYSYISSKIFLDQITSQDNPYSKMYRADNTLPWWKKIF